MVCYWSFYRDISSFYTQMPLVPSNMIIPVPEQSTFPALQCDRYKTGQQEEQNIYSLWSAYGDPHPTRINFITFFFSHPRSMPHQVKGNNEYRNTEKNWDCSQSSSPSVVKNIVLYTILTSLKRFSFHRSINLIFNTIFNYLFSHQPCFTLWRLVFSEWRLKCPLLPHIKLLYAFRTLRLKQYTWKTALKNVVPECSAFMGYFVLANKKA